MIGGPKKRAQTVRDLALAVSKKKFTFQSSVSLEETISRLVAIEGIGVPTAHYIAMRAFAEPDAFPAADRELRRILSTRDVPALAVEIEEAAERWRPWRAYAAMHLYTSRTDLNKP
jgi:AraC family transcriptional regulator of adaptative response / DNA-3-methyladenine glycosylase II